MKIISAGFDIEGFHRLQVYLAHEGYQALRKVLTSMTPSQVTEEVIKSNLRGLGGAGFPAGRKWSFVPKDSPKPKYLVINADEGEPGTFKDRLILLNTPHMLIEGILIAAYAIGAAKVYIYIRGEYTEPAKIIGQALEEARANNYLGQHILGTDFSLDVVIHRGAGAYICGEETALLESLEGKKGWPRLKPPFPALVGLFDCPTVINNVETIAFLPAIINRGWKWFADLGTERNGGTRLFCVSGSVNRPGVYELPMGTPLREIIYEQAGGIKGDKSLKAVIPGGSSAPVLSRDQIDVKMDFDSLMAAGSMAGSGGIIVMDEDTCMPHALWVLTRFYAHESCGQCTPCREGTGWMEKVLRRILDGTGRPEDPENLLRIAHNIMGNTICPLGDAAALPVISFLEKFANEFDFHISQHRCDIEGV